MRVDMGRENERFSKNAETSRKYTQNNSENHKSRRIRYAQSFIELAENRPDQNCDENEQADDGFNRDAIRRVIFRSHDTSNKMSRE